MTRYILSLAAPVALVAIIGVTRGVARPVPAVEMLPSPTAAGSAEPNLAVAPSGRVYMTWLEPIDSAFALRFASWGGGGWNAALTVRAGRDFFVNWADFPSIDVADDTHLAVHWLQRTGKTSYAYGVRIAQSADGGATWSNPVTPHRDSAQQEHGFVTMWREQGKLGAAWLDGRKFSKDGHDMSNEMMLVSTTITASGGIGPETRLDERTCDCCQNAAAMTASGPIIAYRNRSADEIRDIYVTRRVANRWVPGRPVHDDGWKIAACPVNGPALAARNRDVALAWFTAARDTAKVNVAFSSDAGATFGAPIRVDAGKPGGRVDVVLLNDRTALVSWIERKNGDTAAVQVRRVGIKGEAAAPVTIATSSAARASGFPKMVMSGDQVYFAWTEPGRPSSVRFARAAASVFR